MSPPPATVLHVSVPALREQLKQARELLEQARYRQAALALENALSQGLPLVDQLHIRAQRALAYALWKKPDEAIQELSQLLATIRADVDDLKHEIDWEHEKNQDIGHLRFLSAVFQLRGMLYRMRQNPRRAVEDLTLSIYMSPINAEYTRHYLERASALIELNDCLEQALKDLNLAWALSPESAQSLWQLPSTEGDFVLEDRKVYFCWQAGKIKLNADKVRLRLNKIQAQDFMLSALLGLSI